MEGQFEQSIELIDILAQAGSVTVVAIALVFCMITLLFMCWAIYKAFNGFVMVQRETNQQTILLKTSIEDFQKEANRGFKSQIRTLQQIVTTVNVATNSMTQTSRSIDDTMSEFPELIERLRKIVQDCEGNINKESQNFLILTEIKQFLFERENKNNEKLSTVSVQVLSSSSGPDSGIKSEPIHEFSPGTNTGSTSPNPGNPSIE